MDQSRRSFLKSSGALAAGLAAAPVFLQAAGGESDAAVKPETVDTHISAAKSLPYLNGPMQKEVRRGDMIYRPLGQTGEMVSLIGLGGYHIGKPPVEAVAIKLVHAAIDAGINFIDNCWDYNLGISKLRAGKAYKGGYRDKVFHMTKIDGRTKKAAMRQIEECLARIDSGATDAAKTLLALDSKLSAATRADAQTVLATGRPAFLSYPVAAGGQVEIFLDAVQPPRSLLVCGAGEDVAPLAHLAQDLGWRVRVVDGRRAYAVPARFPEVDELIVCPPREFATRGHRIEAGEAVVLMTHNFSHDKEFLRVALASPATYIGVLGPQRRTGKLLCEMADLPGVPLGARSRRRVHGPAGLHIGAEAPEQIALAIVAEIQAVASRRRGGLLKHRRAPLHEPVGGTRFREPLTV